MCEPTRHNASRQLIQSIREYVKYCIEEDRQERKKPNGFTNATGEMIPAGVVISVDANMASDAMRNPGKYEIRRCALRDGYFLAPKY